MTCSHPQIFHASRRSLALGLSLLAACTGRSPGDDATDSGSSTQGPADTGASTGPSASGETTAGPAPTSGLETTSSTPETSTGGDATGTGAVVTTGAADTSTGGDASTSGDTSTGDDASTGDGAALVLDPDSLVVFDLPINSIRYAIAGFDPEQQTCAAVIFSYPDDAEHCDDFAIGENPYVVITPNATPPCMDWDYGGNVTVESASGCVQFTSFEPPKVDIDMVLEVSGAPFTGKIFVGP